MPTPHKLKALLSMLDPRFQVVLSVRCGKTGIVGHGKGRTRPSCRALSKASVELTTPPGPRAARGLRSVSLPPATMLLSWE